MSWKPWVTVGIIAITVGSVPRGFAGDVKITIPKRSHMTPVQRLNQEGVEAIKKHHYEKAETVFYKAYLLDPDDPFTLNNLGYISELQGQVDRALGFYALAGQQATDAVIDRATSKKVEGHSIKEALAIPDTPLQINHDNVEAVRLLSQGRAPEADVFLKRILEKDPNNIFTLNNMGVAKEMEGDSQEALRYYETAATSHSDAAAVVTRNRSWRGKPVNEIAAQNARNLRNRLAKQESPELRVAALNVQGVSAVNRNDFAAANQAFRKAYALDPNNAFAVNNIGYLAEIEGDRETAQFFYDKAQTIAGPNAKVGLATRRSSEGAKLSQVAAQNDTKVEAKVQQERNLRRSEHEPILLRRRDNTVVEEPATPPSSPQQSAPPGNQPQ
jgi:Flp pilus assembly protein TadD